MVRWLEGVSPCFDLVTGFGVERRSLGLEVRSLGLELVSYVGEVGCCDFDADFHDGSPVWVGLEVGVNGVVGPFVDSVFVIEDVCGDCDG